MNSRLQGIYALSPLQQGMVFHALSEPGSDMYVEQMTCTLRGPLNSSLRTAWKRVVDRHPALRTAFVWKSQARPMQVVFEETDLPWEEQDWRDLPESEHEERLRRWALEDRMRGFALHRPPLMRFALFRLSASRWYFVWTHHHAILDGWSAALVLTEVVSTYNALRSGEEFIPAPVRPFRDYILWIEQQDKAAMEVYWREALAGVTKPTLLSTALVKPATPGMGAGEIRRNVPSELSDRLIWFAREHGVTLTTLLIGAWAILLSRYTGEEEVIFGVPSSGRPIDMAGIESMVGMFINTLPIRARVPVTERTSNWLRELNCQQASGRRFEYAALYDIQRLAEMPAGSPLFDTTLTVENYPVASVNGGTLAIEDVKYWERTNYPISIVVLQNKSSLGYRLLYDRASVAADDAQGILAGLENILTGLIENNELDSVPLVSEEIRRVLLNAGVGPRQLVAERCLHQAFEQQVVLHPEGIAVVCGEKHLTYGELDRRANQLAHYLVRQYTSDETPIAILLDRSLEMVIALLGILKAGFPFLPLDPEFPPERLYYILADACCPVVVTEKKHAASASGGFARTLDMYSEWPLLAQCSAQRPLWVVHEGGAAYVIYTSGSTGRPKGVVVPHAAVTNHMDWMLKQYPLTAGDAVLQKTPLTFDASLWEFFLALGAGAGLIMAPPGAHRDPAAVVEQIERHHVTILGVVPTFLDALIQCPDFARARSLRRIFVGGEVLSRSLLDRVAGHTCALVTNLYGPTETAIDSTFHDCSSHTGTGAGIPIGDPIANTQTYVLDARLEPVPAGAIGELYIGGSGLARSYLGQAALTAERFLPDPFSNTAGHRLYRTGDLVRRNANAHLEFVSRNDQQVKIRGVRIEPGEVEAALRLEPEVNQAVVVARPGTDGQFRLIAYVVTQGKLNAVDLRQRLSARLPEPLVPSHIVFLANLSLNSSGKVDRKALPDPTQLDFRSAIYVAPRTSTETRLAEIWAEVLGVPSVGVHDNFFELGGHSLLAIRALALVKERLQLQCLKLLDFFEYPTLAALAEFVEQHDIVADRGESTPAVPVTATAARYWFPEP